MGSLGIPALVGAITLLACPVALAQDQQIGQEGAIWNLGELQRAAYPSTVTAVNKNCPGAHDFHISLRGEATEFLIITGPTVLTGIPPGSSKTSNVIVDLRTISAGPHNQGEILVRCVDCPITCSQDYDVLGIHLTVLGEASSASTADVTVDSPWSDLDLTQLDATALTLDGQGLESTPSPADSGYRWVTPDSFDAMTLVEDAVSSGMAELSFAGTGRAAGNIFTMTITRHAPTPFEMGVPLGTVIQPSSPAYSPMIVGDDGAIALLDEVTMVTIPGYSLDPNRAPPPSPAQITDDLPTWSVSEDPEQFDAANSIINAGYALARQYQSDMPVVEYLRTVVQRSIWYEADPDNFGKERLEQDIVEQVEITDGSQTDAEIQVFTEDLWSAIDLTVKESNVRD